MSEYFAGAIEVFSALGKYRSPPLVAVDPANASPDAAMAEELR